MSMRSARILLTTMLLAGGLFVLAIPYADAAPLGCVDGVQSDFNGDGYADAVVGDPDATVSGHAYAGRVVVLYGDSDGRIGEGARAVVSQDSAGVAGSAEAYDHFGFSLAVADLDCDKFTDLVVGTPYENVNGQVESGYVQVVWGASTGLGTGDPSRQYSQATFGEDIVAGDNFGYAVDVLEDAGAASPYAYALAIGVPGGDVGSDTDAGWVGIEGPGGDLPFRLTLTQDTPGIPGATEPDDRFGASVSLNYLLGDIGIVDVAVGSPTENVGSVVDAGTVTVVRDLDEGIDGAVVYDQNSAGVASFPEGDDRFGYTLDSTRPGSITRLAVGVPYEDIGSDESAGLVQLFSGNGSTLTAGTGLTQDTDEVANATESNDLFGYAVVWARPGLGDTVSRLAVSAPCEDGAAKDTGLVQVFPLSNLGAEKSYTQNSSGIQSVAEAGDRFGAALAVVSGPSERALLVGVPEETDYGIGMVNVIPFGGGDLRAWVPGAGGIPAAADRFGAALAGTG